MTIIIGENKSPYPCLYFVSLVAAETSAAPVNAGQQCSGTSPGSIANTHINPFMSTHLLRVL